MAKIIQDSSEAVADVEARPWSELRESGLLWLINAAVLHPRGFAIGLVEQGGQTVGWQLFGDGREPWSFQPGTFDDTFRSAEATLAAQRASEGEDR